MNNDDPFPQVAQEVRTAYTILAGPSGDSLSDSLFKQRISSLEQDITDLNMTIDIVREDPARFGMTMNELSQRASFISEMRTALITLRSKRGMKSANWDEYQNVDAQSGRTGTQPEDEYVDDEQLTQARLLERQDEDLDELASAVRRIGALGRDMHVELEQQGELLDDLGGRFDGTIGRLKSVKDRIEVVMEQTGRRQFCTIVWLTIIFLVLTFLVVFT